MTDKAVSRQICLLILLSGALVAARSVSAGGCLQPLLIEGQSDVGTVFDIAPAADGEWWAGATDGLFRLTPTDLDLVPSGNADVTGTVFHIIRTGAREWLIAAQHGLFHFSSDGLVLLQDDDRLPGRAVGRLGVRLAAGPSRRYV